MRLGFYLFTVSRNLAPYRPLSILSRRPSSPLQGSEILDLTEFYDAVERERRDAVDGLVKQYHTIGPLLGKIEEVVAGTNSGKSPLLASYYGYWERAIFNALNQMVVKAMGTFQSMMDSRRGNKEERDRKPPLFKVSERGGLTLKRAWFLFRARTYLMKNWPLDPFNDRIDPSFKTTMCSFPSL